MGGTASGTSRSKPKFAEFHAESKESSRLKALDWFKDEANSNYRNWYYSLTDYEGKSIDKYIGSGYSDMNGALYQEDWDDISEWRKSDITHLYDAINKFELKQGVMVNRACDSRIFGAKGMSVQQIKDTLDVSDGFVQNDAFLSASTFDAGVKVNSAGLVLHIKVPPNKGGGAFLGTKGIAGGAESEYLFNNNGVYHFDKDSVYQDPNGTIHVSGEWVGNTAHQTISKNYNKNALEFTNKPKSKGKKSKKKGNK